MNTTEEYWSINGVSLQTLAHNISTWGGSLQSAPSLRGEDIMIPSRPGRVWTPKVPDSVTREFSMWVRGADEDGVIYDEQMFRANWRALRILFFSPTTQLTLTRRWKVDGVLYTATGKGQVLEAPTPEMLSPRAARFQVDVYMADPFFYGEPLSQTLVTGKTSLVVPGDYATSNIQLEILGPNEGVHVTLNDEHWVDYESLVTGEKAIIDAHELLAYELMGGTAINTLGQATSSGDVPWLLLKPGSNTVMFSRISGTGTVKLNYRALYL